MMSLALHSRKKMCAWATIASVAIITVIWGTIPHGAQAAEAMAALQANAAAEANGAAGANPYAERFPDVVLKTHEGKNVRFYSDLLKGKIVLVNFFYVTCVDR